MNYKKYFMFSLLAAGALTSCTKMKDIGILNTGNYGDTSGTLKSVANGMNIGFAAYQGDANYAKYFPIIAREANFLTPGNEMKHGSIVQSDGSLKFTNADAIVNQATSAGLSVFGHTLLWHSQQNATYLKSYAGITAPAATELLGNPGFESGNTGWSIFNTNGATITFTTGSNAHAGTGFMQVVNPTAQTGSQWKVQVSSAAFATTPGKQYIISYWVKAISAGGSIRLSTGPSAAQYQGDQTIGTAWQQVSWTITATLSSTTFLFDMGQVANTYYIDDASVKESVQVPSGAQVALKVDTAMNNFITGMATHYKGKVKAWDVVNEPLTDAGTIRTSTNLGGITVSSDVFFWSDYPFNGVTKDYALRAFQYAAAADPSALLFINDYNLESSKAKTDSMVAYVAYLKGKGAKIDGIGTQMHVDALTTSYTGIDYMFQRLASTGLQVRISELDVATRPSALNAAVGDAQTLGYQASMYSYIINSYLKYVPAAQRYGVTVWGVDDPDSWRAKSLPLLWDNSFAKKPAYSAVMQALKGTK
ncbi:endo-1,4-beta-xylanase [Pinibacter aurantiacus]|uniref:endo-1,4-beta-xylanase n=1 Tax=Pinibacter aurantiacus TaxID=2851599 RepID=A0A9E2W9V5_9BACT|nr:endo-1,4-beta-xylanase [Pinibacter aurantiacus]MBV4360317.1 endo-1,4-beta-xylanase [Pinibacter aurantiacus]